MNRPQQPDDQRRSRPDDTGGDPRHRDPAATRRGPAARPDEPGQRSPRAERGPGSASADVGMSSDGGYAEGSATGTGGADGGRKVPGKR